MDLPSWYSMFQILRSPVSYHATYAICIMTEETSGKPQLGGRLKWVRLSPDVGRIAQHVMEEEGRKEGRKSHHPF